MSEAADAAMSEAADADGRLRDDPLTDRPVPMRQRRQSERDRRRRPSLLRRPPTRWSRVVQGQLKLRGKAADKAAHDANAEAGAPVKASSMMVNTKQL